MKSIDQRAMAEWGVPGSVLMENAGLAVVRELLKLLGSDCKRKQVLILAGKGSNGGDGLVIARQLTVLGYRVQVLVLGQKEDVKGDAALNLRLFLEMGGGVAFVREDSPHWFQRALATSDVLVDALFGTGFTGKMPDAMAPFVDMINRSDVPVVSVDLPSGLNADTGEGANAVSAYLTVTFGLPKVGLYVGRGALLAGQVVVDRISLPESILSPEKFNTFLLTPELVRKMLPRRHPFGHKGTHGNGLLIAGSQGMSGAATLAGKASLRAGLGLLRIMLPQYIAATVTNALPEALVQIACAGGIFNTSSSEALREGLLAADACAIGPGLGRDAGFAPVLENLLGASETPIVLDADALIYAAQKHDMLKKHGPLVMTPHPGEMATLCNCSVTEVQAARVELARHKAREWNAVVVLKGPGTVVASPDGRIFINATGNAGLGTGGTGDVLTGAILGLLAQGVKPLEAACIGVYLHGAAADLLAETYGTSGFTASEVAQTLPLARRTLES
jgi:NAD(P)H-hydrate epimerase